MPKTDPALGRWLAAVVLTALGLASCRAPAEVELPVTPGADATAAAAPAPTPVPAGPKTLVICLGREPESLYLYSSLRLYGAASRETDTVLQAIYDGPYDVRGFRVSPTILEKVPSLDEGDARIEPVSVRTGDVYLNPETLQPEQLAYGKPYLPSGCTDLSCRQVYQGGRVSLDRMVVDFRLLPGLTWSDGEPLTARDSVFSFQLDGAGETPTPKYLVNRTYTYEALDAQTVRWTGIAGFLDPEYASNVWSPLPEHLLGGLSAGEVLEDEGSNRRPVGWGPFVLESWDAGREIVFRRNPGYFRAGEGLPRAEFVVFRFVGTDPQAGIQQLLTGECDVLDETALEGGALADLVDQAGSGRIRLAAVPGQLVTRVEFNLSQRPSAFNLLADLETRQGLEACLDRQSLVDDLLYGLGAPTDSYLPAAHPLYSAQAHEADSPSGPALLEAAGWIDEDGDPATPRLARGVAGVPAGTPLVFRLAAPSTGLEADLAESLRRAWGECGVEIALDLQEPEVLLAPWPDGPAFGRSFDSLVWSWLTSISPSCEMFASWEIASDQMPFGSNASGLRNQDYDRACRSLLLGVPGGAVYPESAARTQALIAEQVPAVPLLVQPRLAAYRPEVCGLEADPSTYSLLWNLEVVDIGENCGGA